MVTSLASHTSQLGFKSCLHHFLAWIKSPSITFHFFTKHIQRDIFWKQNDSRLQCLQSLEDHVSGRQARLNCLWTLEQFS